MLSCQCHIFHYRNNKIIVALCSHGLEKTVNNVPGYLCANAWKDWKLPCPPGRHVSITADQSRSQLIPMTVTESFDLVINADCTLSYWRKKPDVRGLFVCERGWRRQNLPTKLSTKRKGETLREAQSTSNPHFLPYSFLSRPPLPWTAMCECFVCWSPCCWTAAASLWSAVCWEPPMACTPSPLWQQRWEHAYSHIGLGKSVMSVRFFFFLNQEWKPPLFSAD